MWQRALRVAYVVPDYLRIAWWGLASPRVERGPLRIVQGVVTGDAGVLLAVRRDVRGWELPGGNLRPGEDEQQALVREIEEETGIQVEVGRLIGEYQRTGFRPHTTRVFACRPCGGSLRTSEETPVVRWWDPQALPDTLLPWCRTPLRDGLTPADEVQHRREHQGFDAILDSVRIDLRMRFSDDQAR